MLELVHRIARGFNVAELICNVFPLFFEGDNLRLQSVSVPEKFVSTDVAMFIEAIPALLGQTSGGDLVFDSDKLPFDGLCILLMTMRLKKSLWIIEG